MKAEHKFYTLGILILAGVSYFALTYKVSQAPNLSANLVSNSLETPITTPTRTSQDGIVHSSADFISSDPQSPVLMLEGFSDYSLKIEKGFMDGAVSETRWRYLEVFKNKTSILKIDSESDQFAYGYEFAGYDRYDFNGNSYFVFQDWCGGAICTGELIPLVMGKDGLKHGNAVDWPVYYSEGYSHKNGELYIYFYDKSTQSLGPMFRFDKTSGNLIEQKVK